MTVPPLDWNRCFLTLSLAQLGRFIEAGQYETEALQRAKSRPHAFVLSVIHFSAGTLHPLKGDWVTARSLTEQWISVLRAGNVALPLSTAVAASAWILAELGEAHEAFTRLREAEQLLEQEAARGTVFHRSWAYHALGRASLRLGRLDEARRLGNRALLPSSSQGGFLAHAWHLLGDVATHVTEFDAASGESHYRKALALAEPRGMRPLVAYCHLGLGKLYRQTGDDAKAHEHLTTAATMYREMGMTFWLEKAEAAGAGGGP
jgi:tetratricopeptide (TPR) repeat protein